MLSELPAPWAAFLERLCGKARWWDGQAPREAAAAKGGRFFLLPLDMKGMTTLWTKTKHGEMSIERRDSVDAQTPHHSKARAINDGEILVTPGNANVPGDL